MDNLFPELPIPWNFLQIGTGFLLTLLLALGVKDQKSLRFSYFGLVTFGLQSLLLILFHGGLQIKLFAALMLTSALIIQAVLIRKRKR